MHRLGLVAASLIAMLISAFEPASAQSRVALVISNSAYQGAPPLSTTVADATLIAQTLQTAGYDVTGVADLTKETIGTTLRTFLDKVTTAGPNSVAFVYFAGYGAQLGNDDYLVPVDARITSPESVGSEALPLSAVISELAKIPSAARIIVLDAARDGGFGRQAGKPVPPGLALIGAPQGFLVAYSAAPNAVAIDGNGANSPFAAALATVMQQPGLEIEQILKGVRLQLNQVSNGTQTPWMTSSLDVTVKLFDAPTASAAGPTAGAAPKTLLPALGVAGIAVPPAKPRKVTKSRMREMTDDEAYLTAIESDSLEDYQWFVETHPDYSRAGQIWDLINGRREAILWHRTQTIGSRRAYWNYLKRYPDGAHAWEARNWLDNRGDGLPPSDYVVVPDNLPQGYYDEAVGLPDVVPDGFVAPPTVFDSLAPVFVPRPRPWQPKQVIITIQPPQQQQKQTLPNNAQNFVPPPLLPRQNTQQQQAVQPIIISKPADPQQQQLLQGVIQQLKASQQQSDLSKMTDQQLKDQIAKSVSDWQKKQQQQNKQPQNNATAPSFPANGAAAPANANAATPSASQQSAVPSASVSSALDADTAAGKVKSPTLRPRPLQIPAATQHPTQQPNRPVAVIAPTRPLLPNNGQHPAEPMKPVNAVPPNKLAIPNGGQHPVEPVKPVNAVPPNKLAIPNGGQHPVEPVKPVNAVPPNKLAIPNGGQHPVGPVKPVNAVPPNKLAIPNGGQHPVQPTRPVNAVPPNKLAIPNGGQHPAQPTRPVNAVPPNKLAIPNGQHPIEPTKPVNVAPPNKLVVPNGQHPVEPVKPVNVAPTLSNEQLKQQQNRQRALQEQQNKQREEQLHQQQLNQQKALQEQQNKQHEQQLHQQQLNQQKALLEQQKKQHEQQQHQQQLNQQKALLEQQKKQHEQHQQQLNQQKAALEREREQKLRQQQQNQQRAQQQKQQPHPNCPPGTHADNGKCVN